jgi:diguanylate cyclase (GGDEF)-like protein
MFQAENGVDVVISDWMMPGMNGLELCTRVRSTDEDGYTFFIFLTALADKNHLLEGMDAGADDYLSKPLDRDELRARLVAARRVTSLHRQLEAQRKAMKDLNQELHDQSRQDALTGLGNRLRLRDDLADLEARVRRYSHSYCAILCDVDSFKLYNDHYGHLEGDEVLKEMGNVILEVFRTEDSAYRYGGEEFLVILPEQTLESASVAAERLRSAVESRAIPHTAKGLDAVVTVSAGLAELSASEPKDIATLLQQADTALYKAKESGKNRVTIFSNEK